MLQHIYDHFYFYSFVLPYLSVGVCMPLCTDDHSTVMYRGCSILSFCPVMRSEGHMVKISVHVTQHWCYLLQLLVPRFPWLLHRRCGHSEGSMNSSELVNGEEELQGLRWAPCEVGLASCSDIAECIASHVLKQASWSLSCNIQCYGNKWKKQFDW